MRFHESSWERNYIFTGRFVVSNEYFKRGWMTTSFLNFKYVSENKILVYNHLVKFSSKEDKDMN